MPDEKAEILVRYDTQRVGTFTKYIILITNVTDGEPITLKIYGNVLNGQ